MSKKDKNLISIEEANYTGIIDPQELINTGLNILRCEILKINSLMKQSLDMPMDPELGKLLCDYTSAAIRASKEYRDAMRGGLGDDVEALTDDQLDVLFDEVFKQREKRKGAIDGSKKE